MPNEQCARITWPHCTYCSELKTPVMRWCKIISEQSIIHLIDEQLHPISYDSCYCRIDSQLLNVCSWDTTKSHLAVKPFIPWLRGGRPFCKQRSGQVADISARGCGSGRDELLPLSIFSEWADPGLTFSIGTANGATSLSAPLSMPSSVGGWMWGCRVERCSLGLIGWLLEFSILATSQIISWLEQICGVNWVRTRVFESHDLPKQDTGPHLIRPARQVTEYVGDIG